jgi:hypothetical protein
VFVRAHGAEHPNVARAMRNLAGLDGLEGRFDDARRRQARAVEILSAALGPDHRDTLQAELDLAIAERRDGRSEPAGRRFESLIRRCEAALEAGDPLPAHVAIEHATLLAAVGRLQAARRERERASGAAAAAGLTEPSWWLRAEAGYLAAAGDAAGAIRALGRLAERGEARPDAWFDPVFLPLRGTPDYDRLVQPASS